jgi:uncharacterized protein (DUF983 family)
MQADPNLSPVSAGLACKCPRCGHGRLFKGYLSVAPRCEDCDLDFTFADSADGPAVFIILIVGAVVAACALITEVKYQPPIWLHMILWGPLTLGLVLMLLRPFKAVMIALQYRNQAEEGQLDP